MTAASVVVEPEKTEKQLESLESVWWMKKYVSYGEKDLWLSLEWKREGMMDGESGDKEDDDEMRWEWSVVMIGSWSSHKTSVHIIVISLCLATDITQFNMSYVQQELSLVDSKSSNLYLWVCLYGYVCLWGISEQLRRYD